MPKVFPTDTRTEFILCESIRPESGGKVSLLGFGASHELNVQRPPGAPTDAIGGISLGLMFILRDGEGNFTGTIEITDPQGTLLGVGNLNPIDKETSKPHLVYVNAPVVVIAIAGNYTVTLKLDGTQSYRRTLTITMS